jgi:2'-hydroxyisoflavone reductase
MNFLVVGGTGFLGGAIARAALSAGHRVTVFSRGRTASDMPEAEFVVGDRHADLSKLRGRAFDAVADTCAFEPDAVATLLDTLGNIGRYALVSSISVYSDLSAPGMDEEAATHAATAEQIAFVRGLPPDKRSSADAIEAYGPLKREAERIAIAALGDRALILRSGLLIGAGDYTDRLTYWVRRVDRGGLIAVPGDPERLVQMIDVRDAAAFIVNGLENGLGGVFNLTGKPLSMASLLDACRNVAHSDAKFEWCDESAIEAARLQPWTELPLWLPSSDESSRYMLNVGIDKALANGLQFRPLETSLWDILSWDRSRRTVPLKAGMSVDQENALLAVAGQKTKKTNSL